ncbi:MAG: flagellar biosynthesis anti-sigma factor FlgM [Planctomycetia bacterium]|nr:flagellar biosynthesis anti-sigma factor FlgM [Planctomycetia bacterium]
MQVNGLSNVTGVHRVNAVQPKTTEADAAVAEKAPVAKQEDVLDVSAEKGAAPVADVTFSGTKVDGIRVDLVNRIRQEIAAGTYDTDEKMNIALERLLDNLQE